MGEIFIKGNCHNMILAFYCRRVFLQKRCRGATRDREQSLDRRSRGARSPSRKTHHYGLGEAEVRPVIGSNPLTVGHAGRVRHHGKRTITVLGVSTGLTAMQRGLGGFPHERLHQDRCGRRFRTQPLPMSDCRGSPHERLDQDSEMHPVFGVWLMVNE
ncbi:MAG: hypothetical protein F6K56_05915 [Moorea sp. SIO3G5]|nr:hypothetical protein [Moorena sp. SIO3G5]